MAIELATPLVIPEKTFDAIWILDLRILAPTVQNPIRVNIQICPYSTTTYELDRTRIQTINITNLEQSIATFPSMGQAVGAIFSAVQDVVNAGPYYK